MMSLIKIAELVIVFLVVRTFFKLLRPASRRRPPEKPSGDRPKRFDSDTHDISDGDYDEL